MRPVSLALILVACTIGVGSSFWRGDDSDWWSLQKDDKPFACSTLSKEKPNGANFVIAGVNLRDEEPVRDAEKEIPTTSEILTVTRGDAGDSRTQICFKSSSEKGRFKLIFEEGEAGASAAYLIDGGPDWPESYKCVASQEVSDKLATASGLHLGMTASEVKKILGKPCLESNDSLGYFFDYQYLLPLNEGGNGDIDVDWIGTMQFKFRGAKACYIAILTGETQ
jgi:hypothetical protein